MQEFIWDRIGIVARDTKVSGWSPGIFTTAGRNGRLVKLATRWGERLNGLRNALRRIKERMD